MWAQDMAERLLVSTANLSFTSSDNCHPVLFLQVYFANPASTTGRVQGVLRQAKDGVNFNTSMVVWPGEYAYSCLSDVPQDDSIGLLWETNMPGCAGESCRCVFSVLSTKLLH
eukprot:m.39049 g.39049  ORF g.39049 m.39049 type:complete len:113 (-) comp12633_c1_seq2:21-359(-)